MNPTQAETKQQDANSPGVIALSPAEIEQVAGGNSMPIVARYGDLVYVTASTSNLTKMNQEIVDGVPKATALPPDSRNRPQAIVANPLAAGTGHVLA